jgi:hypothetical protein
MQALCLPPSRAPPPPPRALCAAPACRRGDGPLRRRQHVRERHRARFGFVPTVAHAIHAARSRAPGGPSRRPCGGGGGPARHARAGARRAARGRRAARRGAARAARAAPRERRRARAPRARRRRVRAERMNRRQRGQLSGPVRTAARRVDMAGQGCAAAAVLLSPRRALKRPRRRGRAVKYNAKMEARYAKSAFGGVDIWLILGAWRVAPRPAQPRPLPRALSAERARARQACSLSSCPSAGWRSASPPAPSTPTCKLTRHAPRASSRRAVPLL